MERKYKEAVERNLKHVNFYKDISLDQAKIKLGIRKGDTSYDDEIIKVQKKKNKTDVEPVNK